MKIGLFFTSFVFWNMIIDQPIDLREDTISQFIQNTKVCLVLFYSPHCGKCKRYLPSYQLLAKRMAKESPKYILAQINAFNNRNLRIKFNLRYVPTLYLYVNQIPFEIKAIEDFNDLISIIDSRTFENVKYLHTEDQLEKALALHEISIIFTGKNSTKEFNEYLRVSNILEDIQFLLSLPEVVAKSLKIENTSLFLYKKYEKSTVKFNQINFDRISIQDFVKENMMNSILTFNKRLYTIINEKEKYSLFYFHNDSKKETIEDIGNLLGQVKSELKFNIPFFIVNESNLEIKNFLMQYHFDSPKLPRIEIVSVDSEIKRYLLEENINLSNLINFANKWKENNMERYYKSEDPLPYQNSILKKLVGKNFWTFINNTDKDIIINFYSPYCNQSEYLKPIFLEIANKISINTNISFAEINVLENEVKDFNINKTPSIFLFKKSPKLQIIELIGEIKSQSIIEFISNNLQYSMMQSTKEEHITDL